LSESLQPPAVDAQAPSLNPVQTIVRAAAASFEPVFSSGGEWVGGNTDGYFAVVAGVGQGDWK